MKLVTQCSVCRQGLLLKGPNRAQQFICPSCEAPIRVPRPQLSEQEILNIVAAPSAATA